MRRIVGKCSGQRYRQSFSLLYSIPGFRRAISPRNQAEHAITVVEIDHRGKKPASSLVRVGTELAKCAADSLRLQSCKLESQSLAFRRRIQQTLSAVFRALLLRNVSLVDQLLEHATERLFCDVEDLKQVGNFDARVAVDEMEHPMVRATEAQLKEHLIRITDEIAVGKKQKFDDVPYGLS